jgi:hypothetical protein
MLTPKEAFKVGFLRKCSEAGLSAEETLDAVRQVTTLVKSAGIQDFLTKPYETALNVVGSLGKTVGGYGLGAAAIGPAVLGGAAGLGLAHMQDIDDTDVDAIKKREIIDEYYRQIELLRSKQKGIYHRVR